MDSYPTCCTHATHSDNVHWKKLKELSSYLLYCLQLWRWCPYIYIYIYICSCRLGTTYTLCIFTFLRSCGKVMFSQACVKNSVHREGGVYPSMHWGTHLPLPSACWDTHHLGQTPPWADITPPWADTPFPGQTPLPLGRHPSPWTDTPSPRQTYPLGRPPPRPRRPLQRTVRILLECILVSHKFT